MSLFDVDFSQSYAPAEAERGKFVVIDPTTITDLPSSSRGRYALLTYQTNPSDLILSGGNITVSSVVVSNDLTIGTINDTITVDSIQTTLSTLEMLPTTTALICSVTISPSSSATFAFSPNITLLEMYNNSSNKIYFNYNGGTTYADVINKGMIIDGDSFYAIEKNVSDLVVATPSGADVRIFGHRR